MAKEETKVVSVRMPVSLVEDLQKSANENFRSLTGEIIKRLKDSLKESANNNESK